MQSATFVDPSPYRQASDSPFSGPFRWFRLESFESGTLAIPGVTVSTGAIVIGPGPLTDSVDADDGVVDGSGGGGHSLYSGGTLREFVFTFDPAVLGALPTHAGIVVTDIGASTPGFGRGGVHIRISEPIHSIEVTTGIGSSYGSASPISRPSDDPAIVAVSAFLGAPSLSLFLPPGAEGVLIDSRTGLPFTDGIPEVVPTSFGDGSATGETAEDRFFGVIEPRGIASLSVVSFDSADWEVDHLQFGFSAETAALVPAPATTLLLGVGMAAMLCARMSARWLSADRPDDAAVKRRRPPALGSRPVDRASPAPNPTGRRC
ncbi:MAG: hypothetical protein JNK67_24355 [Alphaproteobacteria bacterium]|nr:hypothetical protein [Alphaproteobacteria bacterium]